MDLHTYVKQFSLEEIIKIEESDLQFLHLKNAWSKIKQKFWNGKSIQNLFLFLIIQNSIISYQIAWSGELWREEFSEKIYQDFTLLLKLFIDQEHNTDRRFNFLTSSKYNKRLYNLKTNRLKKFETIKSDLRIMEEDFSWLEYYQDMGKLFENIKKTLKSDGKTTSFAIKMFGYWARVVFKEFIYYPDTIQIPIDSRLQKIYSLQNTQLDIKSFFQKISDDHKIPALHLDSLLRIDYWKMVVVSTKS